MSAAPSPPPRLGARQTPGICFEPRPPGALTADGVLEVGALGGVVGELDPAEPPESLLPPGRVVPLLPRQGRSHPGNTAVRPAAPGRGESPVPSGRRV